MTRRFTRLAWTAATFTYLLIILGAIVRITGSGLGCGEHWPLCNGKLLPPLDLPTLIEYAVTVKLSLPPWTVILHLGTAMLLLATLIVAAKLTPGASPGIPRTPPLRPALYALALGFVTVLFGALTANLGAASACLGFPLCNDQFIPAGSYLQHIHWTHRLFAYTLFAYVVWWAARSKRPGPWYVVALVILQGAVAAAMVLSGLPQPLQAAHVAVGGAVWAALVLAVL